ncbi:D-alanyl-D-alanine carboxypeptidase family protein [Spirillospora sp. CA-294931]|uniref:D-alanyl-D-alanine carboxypeptidase family protein n=1 Tax=Spirillospora sp. CA-294931 TaxID=3240042 RepID=UPI003D8E0F69
MIITLVATALGLAGLAAPPESGGSVVPKTASASVHNAVSAATGPPRIRARSAYLADADTGRTLWRRGAHTRRPIGSITKVMTALVVIRSGRLDRRIRIRPRHTAYAAARNGSVARLRPGDRLTARELLSAMLLPSGCDAAAALADTYGPGHKRFVRKMNRTARALGMTRTRYTDVAGLPQSPGLSTVRDQVTLGRYALRYAEFRNVVSRSRHALRRTRGHHKYVWRNTNILLGDYRGMIGIKSGYTRAAGYSFLFAARRNGRTLVGAVLNSSRTRPHSRFTDATRLLNWGFHRG